MKTKWILIFILAFMVAVAAANQSSLQVWFSDISFPYRFGMTKDSNIAVKMRDGTELKTRLYLPLNYDSAMPAILMRNTYGGFDFNITRWLVENGYAVVEQYVRGRYGSQGQYTPHRYSGRDGYDTIDWMIAQPWSNGKVGTFGCSYLGENQIILAGYKHPAHLAAIADGAGGVAGSLGGQYDYFGFYENGVLNLASTLGWYTKNGATTDQRFDDDEELGRRLKQQLGGLPVAKLAERIVPYDTQFEGFASTGFADEWWEKEGYITNDTSFSVATLHVDTWFDQGIDGTFLVAGHMKEKAVNDRAKHQPVLIGPGVHCSSGKLSEEAIMVGAMEMAYEPIDYRRIYLDWFDYWLKNKQTELPAPYTFFDIHGEGWVTLREWPDAQGKVDFYLSDSGSLSLEPDQETESRSYRYDPLNPVPTLGGNMCCTGETDQISGSVDQRSLFDREDVLSYISEPLENALSLRGETQVRLYVSTSAKDTDFTVKLLDIYPDGRAYNIMDSVFRMSYREGFEQLVPVKPGKVYSIDVDMRKIAYRFRANHRVGLLVSSSNFPRLDRNLNTGQNSRTSTETIIADNTLHTGGALASKIMLPLVEE